MSYRDRAECLLIWLAICVGWSQTSVYLFQLHENHMYLWCPSMDNMHKYKKNDKVQKSHANRVWVVLLFGFSETIRICFCIWGEVVLGYWRLKGSSVQIDKKNESRTVYSKRMRTRELWKREILVHHTRTTKHSTLMITDNTQLGWSGSAGLIILSDTCNCRQKNRLKLIRSSYEIYFSFGGNGLWEVVTFTWLCLIPHGHDS